MIPLGELFALLMGGALITEGAGYLWHRWACHVGVFRPFVRDLLRRRHFDHHTNKYAVAGPRHDDYHPSCDISFHVLGGGLIALIIISAALGKIKIDAAIILLLGFLAHAFLGTRLHALYHVSDQTARRVSILRCSYSWRVFSWLREFHDVHHVVNANYSLVIPIFDVIGGTYISPKKIHRLQAENLFPQFKPELSSSCETPLFK